MTTEHGHSHGHSHEKKSKEAISEPASLRQVTVSQPSSTPPARFQDHELADPSIPMQRQESNLSMQTEDSIPFEALYVHPAQTRANVVKAAQEIGYGQPSQHFASTSKAPPHPLHDEEDEYKLSSETSSLSVDNSTGFMKNKKGVSLSKIELDMVPPRESDEYNPPSMDNDLEQKGHSHSQKQTSMNMKGVFLHVLGDAVSLLV